MGILNYLRAILTALQAILCVLRETNVTLAALLALLKSEDQISGITVKENEMTKCVCTVSKSTASPKRKASKAGPVLTPGTFVLQDAGTGTFTVFGTDATPGDTVDISSVATLTPAPTSDNPSLTVSAPTGMAVTISAPATGSGTGNVTFTATWNDGSVGPFTFVAKITYSGGAITGITVVQS